MASDFHTHNPDTEVRALISSPIPLPGRFTSLEFHPWQLPEIFDSQILPSPDLLPDFAALGEIGIDKLRGPGNDIQQHYLHALLSLAADCQKPVVIHCVHAFQELFAALKHFSGIKVMLHGFNSSPEMLDELWKRNITVSFSRKATDKISLMNKLGNAGGAYGFESDDDPECNVMQLLDKVKTLFNIRDVEKFTDRCFADFLEI